MNYTATRVPANVGKAIGILLHVVTAVYARKLSTKREVIAAIHKERGGPMVTVRLRRKCYTA